MSRRSKREDTFPRAAAGTGVRAALVAGEIAIATVLGLWRFSDGPKLSGGRRPKLYLPYAQFPSPEMDIVMRVAADPAPLISAVRAAVRAVDREAPVTNLNTMAELIRQKSFAFAYIAGLMGLFGLLPWRSPRSESTA